MSGPGFDRRNFLRAAGAGTAFASVAGTVAGSAAPAFAAGTRAKKSKGALSATCTWLGNAGWRVKIGESELLVDPYVTRYKAGVAEPPFNAATKLTVDTAKVDQHCGKPGVILVTHTHWDHFNDVPYIAKRAGEPLARVVGTMTTFNLALAMKVPSSQLSPVKGGEVFDFGTYTVEVVASLHSRNAKYSMLFPGTKAEQPPEPQTIADLPEGDTLAFQVTAQNGPSIFFMGASDYVERNLTGLAPDVAMVPVPAAKVTPTYTERLIEALDRPRTVVAVHWDDFESELKNPPKATDQVRADIKDFTAAVHRVSPKTKVVVPDYLTPYTYS